MNTSCPPNLRVLYVGPCFDDISDCIGALFALYLEPFLLQQLVLCSIHWGSTRGQDQTPGAGTRHTRRFMALPHDMGFARGCRSFRGLGGCNTLTTLANAQTRPRRKLSCADFVRLVGHLRVCWGFRIVVGVFHVGTAAMAQRRRVAGFCLKVED